MKLTIALLSLLAGANAFAPSTVASSRNVAVNGGKDELVILAEKANPIVKFYDPLNLADGDFWGWGNEQTIGWWVLEFILFSHHLISCLSIS